MKRGLIISNVYNGNYKKIQYFTHAMDKVKKKT